MNVMHLKLKSKNTFFTHERECTNLNHYFQNSLKVKKHLYEDIIFIAWTNLTCLKKIKMANISNDLQTLTNSHENQQDSLIIYVYIYDI